MVIEFTSEIKDTDIEKIIAIAEAGISDLQKFHYGEYHDFDFYLNDFTLRHIEIQLKIAINYASDEPFYFGLPDIEYGCVIARNGDEIIGFSCYSTNDPKNHDFRSASISYMAVKEEFRKQGVMRGMIDFILREKKSVGLSCTIENVDIFKSVGFSPSSPTGAQIGMQKGEDRKCQYLIFDDDKLKLSLNEKAISIKGKSKFETFSRRYSNAYKKECARVEDYFQNLKSKN